MRRYRLATIIAGCIISLAAPMLFADTISLPLVTLQPGERQPLACDTVLVNELASEEPGVSCATPTPLPPTPTPVPMLEGVALCGDHDPAVWHPLVKRDAGNAIVCTYGHEHHDDPNTVNDIFGSPGSWYGSVDSISYPWMTHNAAGIEENVAKHEGYKYFVRRDMPCVPFAGQKGCVIGYRAEVHMRGDISDQTTRFHSFALEALVQDETGHQAIVRHGGQIDTGFLGLLVDQGGGVVCPPIATNPPTFICKDSGRLRESSSINPPDGHTAHNVFLPNWYTNHGLTTVSVKIEEWGPIDYTNPTYQLYHDPQWRANNSRGRVEGMSISLESLAALVGADGLITYHGYTDHLGALVQGCAVPATACVPLSIEGAKRENYWQQGSQNAQTSEIREYDVSSPANNKSLIRYPN